MAFDSLTFLVFFICIVSVNFLLPHRFRILLLLVCSYAFYMTWEIKYGLLLFISTLVTYFGAILISSAPTVFRKRAWLAINILINIGILGFYKYANFLGHTVNAITEYFSIGLHVPDFRILLPLGISFYTFKAVGYTIDVYRGAVAPEKNFPVYALFVSFFPQLVAGPIDRSTNLMHQLTAPGDFDYRKSMYGVGLMTWGFFKKLVIADRISILVDTVYNNPHSYTGLPLIFATLLYAFQLYCDFSGYSDIAIGAGKVLGFDFMKNFERPYHAKTIRDYWHRWHISLSTWFRDYLYIPLGGSRVSTFKKYFNLFVTFVVSGLWHGADWKFVIWGGLHGILLIVSYVFHDMKLKIVNALGFHRVPVVRTAFQLILVFLMVDFLYIFFRANTFDDSIYVITHLFSGLGDQRPADLLLLGLDLYELTILLAAILIMETVEVLQESGSFSDRMFRLPTAVRWASLYMLIMIVLVFKAQGTGQFIYFQF